MAVIINEFEIVAEQSGKKDGAQGEAKSPAPPLSPYDIEAVLAHRRERLLRVRAD
jgi:hypothetical protein